MGKTKQLQYFASLAFVTTLFSCTTYLLIELKTPWVDECYSYYGVSHKNFSTFWDSISSGVNFSPPCYFLLNWFLSLFYPVTLDFLRVESSIWTLIGVLICYKTIKTELSSSIAFIAVAIYLAQSKLLLDQSLEARHYTMFFALGAWVIYQTNIFVKINDHGNKKFDLLLFSSHLSLCLVHYLGIIFSAITGLCLLIYKRDKLLLKRIPTSIIFAWISSLVLITSLLWKQSSHLGTWERDNSFQSLLSSYNDSFLFLIILVPLMLLVFFNRVDESDSNQDKVNSNNGFLPIVSIFWISTPFIFWAISRFTSLNLYKDRYFIPKEATYIVIFAFALNFLIRKFNKKDSFVLSKSSSLFLIFFCIGLLFLNAKRKAYSLLPENNYYDWLILDQKILEEKIPIVYIEDPLFFPNSYLNNKNAYLLIDDPALSKTYESFSQSISLTNLENLKNFEEFFLVGEIEDHPFPLEKNSIIEIKENKLRQKGLRHSVFRIKRPNNGGDSGSSKIDS